jgi:hypothetical protein
MTKGQNDPLKPHPAQRQLTGAAGTVFVLNIHCWHSAVLNASNDPRLAIFTDFWRRDSPIMLYNPVPDPSPEIVTRFDPEIQALLKG